MLSHDCLCALSYQVFKWRKRHHFSSHSGSCPLIWGFPIVYVVKPLVVYEETGQSLPGHGEVTAAEMNGGNSRQKGGHLCLQNCTIIWGPRDLLQGSRLWALWEAHVPIVGWLLAHLWMSWFCRKYKKKKITCSTEETPCPSVFCSKGKHWAFWVHWLHLVQITVTTKMMLAFVTSVSFRPCHVRTVM